MKKIFNRVGQTIVDLSPFALVGALATGNLTLGIESGYHADLITAGSLLWLTSDISFFFKNWHPVAVSRINATCVTLGAVAIAATGFHATGSIDWARAAVPLGVIPAAAIVGTQREVRKLGQRLCAVANPIAQVVGSVLHHPYAIASAVNAELCLRNFWHSAKTEPNHALASAITHACIAYGVGALIMPILDYRARNEPQIT